MYKRQFRFRDRNGNIRDVFITIDMIPGTKKSVASLIDISELKRIRRALEAEKERLLVTLRSIGDAVIATDTEGKITLMNRVAEELTGWSEAWGMPKPILQAIGAGSVFTFRAPASKRGELIPILRRIHMEGIGERRAEGLGRVSICDPFHLERIQAKS